MFQKRTKPTPGQPEGKRVISAVQPPVPETPETPEMNATVAATSEAAATPQKRKPGRPKGSKVENTEASQRKKNMELVKGTPMEAHFTRLDELRKSCYQPQGRPLGSKNVKPKPQPEVAVASVTTPGTPTG